MKKTKTKRESKEAKAWKEGFNAGATAVNRQNAEALSIGMAILSVLDNRYQYKNEDY